MSPAPQGGRRGERASRAALYSSLLERVDAVAEEAFSDRVDVLQENAKTRMDKMESAQAKSNDALMDGIRKYQTRIRALEEERAQMRRTIRTLTSRVEAAERAFQQGPGVPPMSLDSVVPPPGLCAPPPPPGLGGHALFGPPAPPLGLGPGAPPPPWAGARARPTAAASAPRGAGHAAPEPPARPSSAPGSTPPSSPPGLEPTAPAGPPPDGRPLPPPAAAAQGPGGAEQGPGGAEQAPVGLRSPVPRAPAPRTPPRTPQTPLGFKSPTVPASPFVHCEGGACIFGFTLRVASGWQVGLVIFSYEGEAALHVKGIVPGGAIEAWNSQVAGGPAAGKTIAPGDKVVQVNNATDAMGMLKELKEQAMLRLTIVRGDPDAAVDLSAVWSGGAQRVRGGRTRLSVGPAAGPATEQGSSPGPDSVAVPSSPLKPDASDFKP